MGATWDNGPVSAVKILRCFVTHIDITEFQILSDRTKFCRHEFLLFCLVLDKIFLSAVFASIHDHMPGHFCWILIQIA